MALKYLEIDSVDPVTPIEETAALATIAALTDTTAVPIVDRCRLLSTLCITMTYLGYTTKGVKRKAPEDVKL
jgi:hypothetical protein